jgi:phage protein U
MLMSLGPIRFEIYPFNATEYDHGHESGFVEKPVLGARPPLEWVGEGAENWSIKARIFPHRFGGLGDLKKLYQARAAGRPLYLMRGDGAQMGWVVIEKVSERSSYLDAEGIGRVIDVDIAVRRSAKPSGGSYFSLLSGLFT